jgi:hypothetical protein
MLPRAAGNHRFATTYARGKQHGQNDSGDLSHCAGTCHRVDRSRIGGLATNR